MRQFQKIHRETDTDREIFEREREREIWEGFFLICLSGKEIEVWRELIIIVVIVIIHVDYGLLIQKERSWEAVGLERTWGSWLLLCNNTYVCICDTTLQKNFWEFFQRNSNSTWLHHQVRVRVLVQSLTLCISSSSSWFWRLWWHSREQHGLNLQLFAFAGIWNRLRE